MNAERHTVAQAVGMGLAAAGIDAVYGAPFGDLQVTPIRSAAVARVLSVAHGRVHGAPAAVHKGEGRFVVGRPPPDGVAGVRIDDTTALAQTMADLPAGLAAGGSMAFHLHLDPASPAANSVAPPVFPQSDRFVEPDPAVLDALSRCRRPVMLVGPGVVSGRHVAGLHALATAGHLGVLNTWGAKGVFDWRSHHHLATVGLQRDDLRLGGLAEADLVLTAGLDPTETPGELASMAALLDLPGAALGPLAERWSRRPVAITVPPLRARLASVTQNGWARTARPLAPSQVTRNYGALTAGRGLVVSQPGTAGFWVARTFPTTVVGEAVVPGRGAPPGFALAAALVARMRRPGLAVLAVLDGPLDDVGLALRDEAGRLGVPLVVELWDPEGPQLSEAEHRERLTRALFSLQTTVLHVATDGAQLARMEEVAGPVVAWDGEDGGHR